MQSNADGTNNEQEESLFGSPPTSPRIGRSPSPALALPSRSESIVNLQNVGTIALPGSHYNSELPIDPLALPSYSSTIQGASQPPAQPQIGHSGSHSPSPDCSQSSKPSSLRMTSQGPFSGQSRGNDGRRRREDDSSFLRLPPPEITLPDPTAPPPANWLRSQSALLGHAGLVGRINPSSLSSRHFRGSTATNPIVIDDDKHSRQHQSQQFSYDRSMPTPRSQLPIDSNLPTPSIQEIVQILIKQREIFSILNDIFKLLQKGNPSSTTITNSSASPGPAPKKRKLNKVPAGAVDWDVPYPFHPGEGPHAYSSTWERTRGKQLVSQLVSLIKSASRKASIRKYKEWEHAMPKVAGHDRPESTLYGLPNTPLQEILADASNNPVKPPDSSTSSLPTPASESSSFDELFALLLAATPNSADSDEAAAVAVPSTNLNSLFGNINSPESTPELDQSVIDNWVSIFQTYQVSSPDEPAAIHFSDSPYLAPPFAGASLNPNLPLDIGSWDGVSDVPGGLSSSTPAVDSLHWASLPMDIDAHARAADSLSSNELSSPNPSQLGVSIPPSFTSEFNTLSGTPSIAYSPIFSSSSFGDAALITHMLHTTEYPDTSHVSIPKTRRSEDEEPSPLNSMIDDAIAGGHGGCLSMGLMNSSEGSCQLAKKQPVQEHSPDFPAVPLSALLPAFSSSVYSPPANTGTSSVFTPPVVRPYDPSGRMIEKAELLKRARDRRAHLVEEILKTRMQLWETTIEHGVLTRLAKFYA
ncbi:hypothetical protein DFJ43DRAFT_1064670 [Lentinula guzmanii]|uniref:Uncharacterized protein n=1 Tax=Lentinula guzmanii TaxID=2804957 RepID=A0AA38JCG5_9AGAR|nr:hypothetical protein DFJ43DRAFT_1064670 [Lentinula guzmanii]